VKPRHAAALARLRRFGIKDVVLATLFSLVGVVVGSILGGGLLMLSLMVSPTGKWLHNLRALLIPVPALVGGYVGFFWSLTRALRSHEDRN
jgi:predicted permease